MQARVELVVGNTTTNTWTSYGYWDEAKQEKITLSAWSADKAIDNANWKPGLSNFEYDKNGHLKRAVDFGKDPSPTNTRDDTTFTYINNAQGMVMRRQMEYWNSATGQTEFKHHRYIYANGATVGDTGNDGDVRLDYAQQLAAKQPSREELYKSWTPVSSANFDQNYEPINREYPGAVSSTYVAKRGDTLYSIAAQVWGDASMWYLLADVNGLSAEADLAEGQMIRIPNKVANIHNNSSTIRPYSAGERIGDTSPTLPDAPLAPIPPPKPQQSSGSKKCGGLAKIIVAVVAVVATIYTAGLAASAFSVAGTAGMTTMAAGTAVLGGAGGGLGLAAAAVGGALGNAAGQLAGMGLGIQEKFNWGGVATNALTSMAMASFGDVGSALGASKSGAPMINAAINSSARNIVSQGISIATGQQKSFSWSSVAASAIAAPMAKLAQQEMFGKGGAFAGTWAAKDTFAGHLAQSGVSAVVSAASRVVVTGGRLSWTDVAADAISNAVGSTLTSLSNNTKPVGASQTLVSINARRSAAGLEPIDPNDSEAMSIVRGIANAGDEKTLGGKLDRYQEMLLLSGVPESVAGETIDRMGDAFARKGSLNIIASRPEDQAVLQGIPTSVRPAEATFGLRIVDDVLQGTGRLVDGFGGYLKDNPAAMYALEGIDFIAGPAVYAARKGLTELTPAGDWIDGAQQTLIGNVADRMAATGYNSTDATLGGVGALTLMTMAVGGVAGAASRLENVASVIANVKSRLGDAASNVARAMQEVRFAPSGGGFVNPRMQAGAINPAGPNSNAGASFVVAKHGDMPSPRPGQQSHHGVMSAWMKARFPDYDPNLAPAVLMPEANHRATFGVYNRWRAETKAEMGGVFDWKQVPEPKMLELSEKMFDAAEVPDVTRQNYWDQYIRMKGALTK